MCTVDLLLERTGALKCRCRHQTLFPLEVSTHVAAQRARVQQSNLLASSSPPICSPRTTYIASVACRSLSRRVFWPEATQTPLHGLERAALPQRLRQRDATGCSCHHNGQPLVLVSLVDKRCHCSTSCLPISHTASHPVLLSGECGKRHSLDCLEHFTSRPAV